ncbi:hypothetical protein GGI21_004526, partial [Coemansia aciculifera]
MSLASVFAKAAEGAKHVSIPSASALMSQLVRSAASKENTFTAHRFSDPLSRCIAAMLVVLAATAATSGGQWWEQGLMVAAALALPVLALHSSAYTA